MTMASTTVTASWMRMKGLMYLQAGRQAQLCLWGL